MANEKEKITDEKSKTNSPRKKIQLRQLVLFISIIIIFSIGGYGYFYLIRSNITILKIISYVQINQLNVFQQLDELRQTINQLTSNNQRSLELVKQQEKMIADWQAAQAGNNDQWYLAEAQYLVRLAHDYAQFYSTTMILSLLQKADEALQNVKNLNVTALRQALANDIANVQAVQQIDVTTLYLQLTAIDQQINQIPLAITTQINTTATTTNSTERSWWQKGFDQSLQMLRQIVIVRNTNTNVTPLILPEEKMFLYQNLHAQLENAMWGLLHHNRAIYKTSIQRASEWIKKYFNQENTTTATVLHNLQNLENIDIVPSTIPLTATLQLFTTVLSPTEQSSGRK